MKEGNLLNIKVRPGVGKSRNDRNDMFNYD